MENPDFRTLPKMYSSPPLVSIAVVSYNHLRFLREAVDSCLSQDYPSFEVVIGDDGSTDGSSDYLAQLALDHPEKIKVILGRENRGVTHNHNAVLAECSGDYVAWMGGDDILLPGKLSTQVRFMESNPDCVLSFHDTEMFDSDTGAVLEPRPSGPETGTLLDLIRLGPFNDACSTMVRASAVPNLRFDERLSTSSDWLYWVGCLRRGGKIMKLNGTHSRYRRHDGSVTRQSETKSSEQISVATLDHMITCQILLRDFPNHASAILLRYLDILMLSLFSIRKGKALGDLMMVLIGASKRVPKAVSRILSWTRNPR